MQDGGEILWSLDADVPGSDSDEHVLSQEAASAGHHQAAASLPSQVADELIQSLVRRGHITLICRRPDWAAGSGASMVCFKGATPCCQACLLPWQ